jgi:hypothetical protein
LSLGKNNHFGPHSQSLGLTRSNVLLRRWWRATSVLLPAKVAPVEIGNQIGHDGQVGEIINDFRCSNRHDL